MIVKPRAEHKAFRDELLAELQRIALKYDDTIPAIEQCALFAHTLGQMMAFQDQRKYTPEMVVDLVAANIQQGNNEVLQNLLNTKVRHD